ncbi:MAG: hypothetical protein ACI8WB_005445, partial [Phenylobacterium sp.]
GPVNPILPPLSFRKMPIKTGLTISLTYGA